MEDDCRRRGGRDRSEGVSDEVIIQSDQGYESGKDGKCSLVGRNAPGVIDWERGEIKGKKKVQGRVSLVYFSFDDIPSLAS